MRNLTSQIGLSWKSQDEDILPGDEEDEDEDGRPRKRRDEDDEDEERQWWK